MPSRKLIIVIAAACVVTAAVFIVTRGTPVKNVPVTGDSVLILGDSLAYGTGSESGGFVRMVSESVGVPIANYGVPGDTTAQALARIPPILARHPRPAVVMVILGGNDYLRDVPEEQTFRNLRSIVSAFHDAGAAVMVLGVRGGLLRDGFEDEFEKLARETGSILVPDILDGVFGVPRLMSDAVHPNDAGYAVIAARIAPVLSGVLSGDVR